jgi:hypothetical protein
MVLAGRVVDRRCDLLHEACEKVEDERFLATVESL